ncbi:exosome complex RNA-binding protein Csl4 [Candidatus Micrarchaeota archaeon]|nr:exosome complex RNA-binding protein Csl4 [Candidatus Micrarchaeota archaeon]
MMAFPGMLLGTEEEYMAGEGTYAENGKIYANITGEVSIGTDKKIVISSNNRLKTVRPGTVVYGRIEEIFEPVALVKLEPIYDETGRQVFSSYFVTLHVSNIKMGYVNSVKEEVRIGDILKARVEDMKKDFIHISIKDSDLGVIKAFCSECRGELLSMGSSLQCGNCGKMERRKLAAV